MKFFVTGIFFSLSICLHGQNICDEAKLYGVEIPRYKKHYNLKLQPSTDSSSVPVHIWKRFHKQVDSLCNRLLEGKLQFKRVYVNRDNKELYDSRKRVVDDFGKTVNVKYRFVFDLVMNSDVKIAFGVDTDIKGNILDETEVPLVHKKSFPAIITCDEAAKTALSVSKQITSFTDLAVYYNAGKKQFEWRFVEKPVQKDKTSLFMIIVNATTGNLSSVDELVIRISEGILEEG